LLQPLLDARGERAAIDLAVGGPRQGRHPEKLVGKFFRLEMLAAVLGESLELLLAARHHDRDDLIVGARARHSDRSVDVANFRSVPDNFRLIPGMTLEADIKVGTRSVAMYLLGGLLRHYGEAMRER
jgi:hypothetical protein